MRWTDRQRAMLAEMGLRVWAPPAVAPSTQALPTVALPAEPAPAAGQPAAAPPALAQPALDAATVPAAVAGASPRTTAALGEAAVGTMDWPALRDAVAGCRACSLCESRRNTVFGVGHTQAHWMFVGEAPGEQEDLRGEPFVGPAGQLLDAMLDALGLTRDEAPPDRQVFIANTLKCRPPANRNPQPDELARCEPYLLRQIALVRPRILVALGRFAAQALLGSSEPIGRLRGTVHRYAGVPLVVTYHPSYLLRQPADKAKSWDDLCLAAELAAGLPTGPAQRPSAPSA